MLSRGEEEGAVDERVAVEDNHEGVAEDADNAAGMDSSQRREDEASGLVVAVVALVLHLREAKQKKQMETFYFRVSSETRFTNNPLTCQIHFEENPLKYN